MFNLNNKTFVITGTSSGIGFYLASNICKLKCKVIGISRKKTTLSHKNFKNICGDINSINDIEYLYKTIKKKYKKIDVLINNAGLSKSGYDLNNFNANIQTNLISTFALTKRFINLFDSKGGNIINISSIASKYGFSNNPGYNASKAGLNSLTQSIANDYSKKKIRCNSILLGYFKTRMTEKSFNSHKLKKQREDKTMLKRWGEKKEILGPILFLSSNLSNYITGQSIAIDGGWTSKSI